MRNCGEKIECFPCLFLFESIMKSGKNRTIWKTILSREVDRLSSSDRIVLNRRLEAVLSDARSAVTRVTRATEENYIAFEIARPAA